MVFGKRNQTEVETAETKVWECTSEDCNCWIRDNFKFEQIPKCPICDSEMVQSTKLLQVVNNNTPKW